MRMVLVTGATGLVGRFIVERLLEAGKPVRALRRSSQVPIGMAAWPVEWIEGDILDVSLLSRAVAGCEWVIHSAAVVSYQPRQQKQMYRVNVTGTANLVNACLEEGEVRLCHISSVAALGKGNQPEVNEESKWEPSRFNTRYGQTKYEAEKEVWRGMAEGLEAVIVNPSLVLGPGDTGRSSTRLFGYVLKQRPFYPLGEVNYVDVRDVAEVVYQLMEEGLTGERFIVSASHVSYQELLSKIAQVLDRKKPAILLSSRWISLLWRLEDIRSRFMGSSPLITRETALIAQRHYVFDNRKVRQTLGFSFRSLDETLEWAGREILSQLKQRYS